MSYQRSDLKKDNIIGECLLEVTESEVIGGTGKNGKPWSKLSLKCKVHEPEKYSKRMVFGSVWMNQTEELIAAMGKDVDKALGTGTVEDAAIVSATVGGFFRANIGVDDRGFSTIAKILPHLEEKV